MKNIFSRFQLSIIYILCIIVFSFIFTIFEYLGLSFSISKTVLTIINLVLAFIYAYINASKSSLNGYKSGFRSGIKILVILLILNLITFNNFTFKTLIYFFIIMLTTITSGIISKNKQKK